MGSGPRREPWTRDPSLGQHNLSSLAPVFLKGQLVGSGPLSLSTLTLPRDPSYRHSVPLIPQKSISFSLRAFAQAGLACSPPHPHLVTSYSSFRSQLKSPSLRTAFCSDPGPGTFLYSAHSLCPTSPGFVGLSSYCPALLWSVSSPGQPLYLFCSALDP